MKKRLPLIGILGLFSMLLASFATAAMECSVVPFSRCPAPSVKVIGMTGLSQGGSHASMPTDQMNAMAACCSGVEGISMEYAKEGANIYLTSARDAHVSRVSGENGIKINGVSCGYFNRCDDYDTCVFSISGDRDAHISDCGNYAFSRKLCCREGRLIGEELPITPEEYTSAYNETTPAPEAASTENPPASPEEQISIPLPARRRAVPFHLKLFLRSFLKGGLTGSFLREQ